jgi:hypothetical protein
MPLAQLINLLTCGALEDAERDEILAAIANAPSDEQYHWVDDDAQLLALAIIYELSAFIASGDKVDEVHEQIQDMFDDFPGFPDQLTRDSDNGMLAYYEWLDAELRQRAVDEGGYALVAIEGSGTDDMDVLVVYRRDVDAIIEGAASMGVTISSLLDYHRALQALIDRRPQ